MRRNLVKRNCKRVLETQASSTARYAERAEYARYAACAVTCQPNVQRRVLIDCLAFWGLLAVGLRCEMNEVNGSCYGLISHDDCDGLKIVCPDSF